MEFKLENKCVFVNMDGHAHHSNLWKLIFNICLSTFITQTSKGMKEKHKSCTNNL